MKHNRYLLGFALLIAGALPAFSQVSNDNEDGVNKVDQRVKNKGFVPGQVLVKFKEASPVNVRRAGSRFQSVDKSNVDAVLQKFGVETMEKVLPNENPKRTLRRASAYNGLTIQERDLSQLYLVETDAEHASQTQQLVKRLQALDEVEFAEPNYKVYLMDTHIADSYSGNPMVNQQWYLDNYGVKQLWNKPIVNSQRPVIAILDTGVDLTHPDLSPNLWTNTAEAEGESDYDNDGNGFAGDVHGWDFVNNTGNVRDNNMHGTHVAGIAAAANNSIGIVGANPKALIMPITVMQSDGTGDVATIIKGIDYAVANGATVLNLSLGTYSNSRALRQSLENAYQSAVIVAAAGNEGLAIYKSCGVPYSPSFPAAYSFVLGVMATGQDGNWASFTNYDCDGPNYSFVSSPNDPDGFSYELQAPGVNILSTIPGGKYKALNGTSMATPLVAGAISALKMVKQYDTQEILWGDLTHTSNILGAYNLTSRPADLEMVRMQIKERKELADETEEDYSGDGEVDAGETVNIYPVLRTTWGAAKNIKMHLEIGENEDPSVVQILSGTVSFGANLSSYGKGVSLNPLQIKVPSGIADGRHIRLKFVATCDGLSNAYEKEFVLIATNMVKLSGLITENRTLTADHVYYVNENLAIPEGLTLTIEPGTRLEFAEGMGLASSGKLIANGTPQKPIVFTGHKGALWAGVWSHESTGRHENQTIYSNDANTLFTLLPTVETPNVFNPNVFDKYFYTNTGGVIQFWLHNYTGSIDFDMTSNQGALTDPNFLTPAILRMRDDIIAYANQYPSSPTEQEPLFTCTQGAMTINWYICDNPRDTISYCRIEGCELNGLSNAFQPYMKDCVFTRGYCYNISGLFAQMNGSRLLLTDTYVDNYSWHDSNDKNNLYPYSNLVNNIFGGAGYYALDDVMRYSNLANTNYMNNYYVYSKPGNKYTGKAYALGFNTSKPELDHADKPSYLGTSREDIIRPYIFEIGNAIETYGRIDLSNMPTTPYPEAHGIVWKVCVNGKDAQDEYENLAPLGVGKHKFQVYFNRPMNKAKAPQISFGVRDPWTQNVVAEDASWNAAGTIYTAYVTITGKTKSDGVNRIYVQGAEDNEFFECPYEKTRFNIQINAAGSMATGFMGTAGLGKVTLNWDNSHNDFDDAMGFNVYRYHEYEKLMPVYDEYGNEVYETDANNNYIYDEYGFLIPKQEMRTVTDTVCLNTEILDIEATEYIDYDVVPGTTYHYYYKVLNTDLQEYDVSNVVAVTPKTASLGDANGSGAVDVADVITTVNFAAGMEPKPFIFEAADMNKDNMIDILDVVGIIRKILPSSSREMTVESVATYTIEDGVVYVDSPVDLAGVQVQLALDGRSKKEDVRSTEDLNGFEQASAWLTDNDYLFLAYNMNGKTLSAGKHALLRIGDAEIASIRLSDAAGHNVLVEQSNPTSIEQSITDASTNKGIYNIHGQRVAASASQLEQLPKGVYIVDGKKVIKWK